MKRFLIIMTLFHGLAAMESEAEKKKPSPETFMYDELELAFLADPDLKDKLETIHTFKLKNPIFLEDLFKKYTIYELAVYHWDEVYKRIIAEERKKQIEKRRGQWEDLPQDSTMPIRRTNYRQGRMIRRHDLTAEQRSRLTCLRRPPLLPSRSHDHEKRSDHTT